MTLPEKRSLNMTLLALNLSNDVNGVAKKHGEVSQNMFPGLQNKINNKWCTFLYMDM